MFRIFSEYFREPDAHLGYLIFNFSMGQILSIFLLAFGVAIFFKNEK